MVNQSQPPKANRGPHLQDHKGHAKLTKMSDEELVTQHTWLESKQYDTAVRDTIDDLWTEVEKRDMWYAMGAQV